MNDIDKKIFEDNQKSSEDINKNKKHLYWRTFCPHGRSNVP